MWMWQETLLQNFVKWEVNLTFFAPWLPWQQPPFWIFSTPTQKLPHTTVDIPTKFHEVWWKESNIFVNPPFFGSMAKYVQPIPIFFGLSRSTRCGCFSYQVSSISVRRVTCYDFFCVFQFLSILAVSTATAAIFKKSTLNMAYDIPTSFHIVWSRHLREIERIKMCGRIRIIVKKKHRIAIHHQTAVRVM